MRAFHVSARWNSFSRAVSSSLLRGCGLGHLGLGQLRLLAALVVAHGHDERQAQHGDYGHHAEQLANLHHRHTAHYHHQQHDAAEQHRRGQVFEHDEESERQHDEKYVAEGLAVGPPLALHGAQYLGHGQYHRPLAISEGWNEKPSTVSTRCAPLMLSPAMSTASSVMKAARSTNGVIILK